ACSRRSPQIEEPSASTSTLTPATFLASHPFSLNIILRSCDEPPVDFYVHRAVLALSSPLFADLFSLRQPLPKDDSESRDGKDEKELPVVQVSERAEILDKALRSFYPETSPFSDSAFTSSTSNTNSNDADSRRPPPNPRNSCTEIPSRGCGPAGQAATPRTSRFGRGGGVCRRVWDALG
ncbi:hypothetical protein C8F01DRAFT_1045983, partial [Mycena amicta]